MRSPLRRTLSGATAVVTAAAAALALSPASTAAGEPTTVTAVDFESGDWAPWTASGAPALAVVADPLGGDGKVLKMSNRTQTWHTIQSPSGIFTEGTTYTLTARVLLPDVSSDARFIVKDGYHWAADTAVPKGEWTTIAGDYTADADDTQVYLEIADPTATVYVDDIRITTEGGDTPATPDLTLPALQGTMPFPLGVAVDSRETTGPASDLLLRHFGQITAENHMKVESWYDGDRRFTRDAQATALLDYAQRNDLRVYGHVLAWHSQTPDWFFQDDTGRELTASDADRQLLRDRLKTHIFSVAKSIADDYGPYGSDTNPLVAWDVVNEVVADQATTDGLRTSRWHDVLGEEYIHLAFRYADEAFNDTYAADGADRPVKLFINDYNTEQSQKGAQYEALVKRMLAAGDPIDGVGHQFHVSLNTSIGSLRAALDRFAGLGLAQAVTELDVTINPADLPGRIKQGYYYQDVFDLLRDYHEAAPGAEKIFSATVWGLSDDRSWRSEQQPLLFDGRMQAKPAYYGAADDPEGIPPLVNTADVFGGDVALTGDITADPAWRNLPPHLLTGDLGGFQLRWNDEHLTALIRTVAAPDRIDFRYGDDELAYTPGSSDGLQGVTAQKGDEHFTVVHLPHSGVTVGATSTFDVRVASGGTTGAWNQAGGTGQLTFLEPLSTVDVPEAAAAPAIDATIDDAWTDAPVLRTGITVEGEPDGASADARLMWRENALYVLLEVTDPVADNTSSDPWNQDSIELFLDLGNEKAGAYGPNATQIRVTAEGELSFGTGDAQAQRARVLGSATARTTTGYVVELGVALTGQSGGQSDVPLGGAGTFHGLDLQVNDGRDGARHSVRTWADPTGTGYQDTGHWGVARLAPAADTEPEPEPEQPTTPGKPGTGNTGGNGKHNGWSNGDNGKHKGWDRGRSKGGPEVTKP